MNIVDSMRFAAACGVSNAMESRTGYVRIDNVERIFKEVKVVRLEKIN